MRKLVSFVVMVVIGVLLAKSQTHSKAIPRVFASEPSRFQKHAQINIDDTTFLLQAYCDTGNGVMLYVGTTAISAGGVNVAAVPNGCEKSK